MSKYLLHFSVQLFTTTLPPTSRCLLSVEDYHGMRKTRPYPAWLLTDCSAVRDNLSHVLVLQPDLENVGRPTPSIVITIEGEYAELVQQALLDKCSRDWRRSWNWLEEPSSDFELGLVVNMDNTSDYFVEVWFNFPTVAEDKALRQLEKLEGRTRSRAVPLFFSNLSEQFTSNSYYVRDICTILKLLHSWESTSGFDKYIRQVIGWVEIWAWRFYLFYEKG